MKKTLLLAFSLILVLTLAFGLSSCQKDDGEDAVTYTLDSAGFSGIVEYDGTLDLTGLYLVPSEGERIPVTSEIIGSVDTRSVGEKQLTFTYAEQSFTVNYTVKFLVTYVVNGVEHKQLVLSASEVVEPEAPVIIGKQFEGWSRELPNVLTSNVVIEAVYKTLSSAQDDVFTWLGNGVIDLTGYAPDGADFEVLVLDEFEDEDSSLATVNLDAGAKKINYSLKSSDPVIISFKAYNGGQLVAEKSWYIEKVAKPTLTISDNSGILGITVGDRNSMQTVNNVSDIEFKYQITCSNQNVNVNEAGDVLYVTPLKAGVTNVTIKAINSMNAIESIDLEYCVVVKPQVFDITELSNEYGIENIWSVGGFNMDKLPALTLSYANAGAGFLDNVSWVADDADVTVNNGAISFATTDKSAKLVNVVARFSYGGITLDSQPISIRCVFGGVNVFNYNDLYSETVKSNPRPVVLQSSIKDDFSATNYKEIHTTFEDGYYVNSGNPDAATIKVLLQFKSDVYGNGYEINAHNATLGTLDESGALTSNSIFRGPLNLIAFSQSEANGAISAKAQDNICFAVYEGVTLNNIILKSGDLTPDPETGKLDLTDLDYAGTTVEVMGDDVTIEYSRISNGRNIVRAFGDAYDDEKVINVVIRNSILGYSREFILRIGSNCFVACPYGTELDENDKTELEYEMEKNPSDLSPASPLLPGDDGDDYKISKQLNGYSSLSESEKADYDEKYIKTFVTVENSVFEEAGIFAIALETHFAGNYLHAGSIFGERFGGFTHWHNLAKTSYGAKLTFEGDVRLYNWKPLSEIDSSVLVDNNIKNVTGFGGQNFNPEIFEFSVSDMVKYLSGVSGYRNIIDNIDGTDYVHNGIVIYGGGKNYSIFDNNVSSASFNHAFQHYPVTFGDVKQELLTLAAGGEEFAFFIYDKSGTFTYNEQKNLKNKYDCIYN